jgi:glycosyltransferase involved in cell wall biosynthesis
VNRTIAMLHYAGPPTIGGVEATIAAHARVMIADGHHVRIVAGSGGPISGAEVLIEPDFASRGAEIEPVNRSLAAGDAGQPFEALTARIAERLAPALAGTDAAIIHNVLTLHKNLAFTAALHRLHTAGLAPHMLAWCHDFAWLDPLYTPELHPGYPWKLLHTAWPGVRYVAVSEDRQAMLAGLLNIPLANIAVVPPGIDLAAFLKLERETVQLITQLGLLQADPLLLLPARITRRKNIELAVAITGSLRALGLRPRLVVTGPPGPHNPANTAYLNELRALRRATGDEDSVVFLYEQFVDEGGRPQPVSDAMLADMFRLADGLLFPSRYEGFGIPILEAALAGIPIFCSDIPPFRATAGDAAVRFDPEAPPEAAAARIAAALRVDTRAQLRRQVRLTFTWDAIYRRDITPLLMERSETA